MGPPLPETFPFLGYCGSLVPSAPHFYHLKVVAAQNWLSSGSLNPRLHCYAVVAVEDWEIREDSALCFKQNRGRICPFMKFSREKLVLLSDAHSYIPCHTSQPGTNLHRPLKA